MVWVTVKERVFASRNKTRVHTYDFHIPDIGMFIETSLTWLWHIEYDPACEERVDCMGMMDPDDPSDRSYECALCDSCVTKYADYMEEEPTLADALILWEEQDEGLYSALRSLTPAQRQHLRSILFAKNMSWVFSPEETDAQTVLEAGAIIGEMWSPLYLDMAERDVSALRLFCLEPTYVDIPVRAIVVYEGEVYPVGFSRVEFVVDPEHMKGLSEFYIAYRANIQ